MILRLKYTAAFLSKKLTEVAKPLFDIYRAEGHLQEQTRGMCWRKVGYDRFPSCTVFQDSSSSFNLQLDAV